MLRNISFPSASPALLASTLAALTLSSLLLRRALVRGKKKSLKSSGLRISQLNVYPVKSCAGIEVKSSTVVSTGFKYDRKYRSVPTYDDG